MDPKALILELKRRRVFRALVVYGLLVLAILQIIEPVMHGLHWPDAVLSYVVVALGLGFPIVVSLAWIFDVREGRLERPDPVRGAGLRGWRLVLVLTAIGVVAAAPGIGWNFLWRTRRPSVEPVPSIAVLPFADMSSGKDQEYFSDGIAEEILNGLAQSRACGSPGARLHFLSRESRKTCAASARSSTCATCWKGAYAAMAIASASPRNWSTPATGITAGRRLTSTT